MGLFCVEFMFDPDFFILGPLSLLALIIIKSFMGNQDCTVNQ